MSFWPASELAGHPAPRPFASSSWTTRKHQQARATHRPLPCGAWSRAFAQPVRFLPVLQFHFDSFNKRETRGHLPFVLQVLFPEEVDERDLLLLDPLPEEAPGRQRVAHHADGVAEQHL